MSGTDNGREQIERRQREGFETFRPSEQQPGRYDELKRTEEFTLEGLRADPWEVVNKAIPEAPSDELLHAARAAARRCGDEAFAKLQANPLGNMAGMDQDYQGARARQSELDQLAHWRAIGNEPVTIEAIARDPWNAVVYGLPQDGSAQLYETVAQAAYDLLYGPPTPPPFAVHDDREWSGLGSQIKDRWQGATDLWAQAEEREQIGPAHQQGHFLSLNFIAHTAIDHLARGVERALDIAGTASGHLARSVERALDVFFEFFVSEPKLTSQQVHEHLQAAGNVETLHAADVAAGVRENEAAHDWQSVMTINQQQYHDVRLAQTLGTPVTAEANLGYDEHEAARQQQKLSM